VAIVGAICGGFSRIKQPVIYCLTCKARKRSVAIFLEWYGWTTTCLGCGDQWSDGEMHDRPFMRRWRQQSISHAKQLWAQYGKPAP